MHGRIKKELIEFRDKYLIQEYINPDDVKSPKGLLSFAVGGVLLIFTAYLVAWGALSETRLKYSGHPPLIYGSILGFGHFFCLA